MFGGVLLSWKEEERRVWYLTLETVPLSREGILCMEVLRNVVLFMASYLEGEKGKGVFIQKRKNTWEGEIRIQISRNSALLFTFLTGSFNAEKKKFVVLREEEFM